MPETINPGVYIEEASGGHQIGGVATSITAFMGRAMRGPSGKDVGGPLSIRSFAEYEQAFGGLSHDAPMSYAVQDFFLNSGAQAVINRICAGQASCDEGAGAPLQPSDYLDALASLDKVDLINLLCIPADSLDQSLPAVDIAPEVWSAAAQYCAQRRAMLIVDSPASWTAAARSGKLGPTFQDTASLQITGDFARNAAVYFPRIVKADPLSNGDPVSFPPCGSVAGVIARTDAQRGVWKAPAGTDAVLNGILALEFNMTDEQVGLLNPLGINCLKAFPQTGPVIWGARTLRGADQFADDFKYVAIRRLTLFLEESIYRGTKWVVFEPNGEPLWAQIRLCVGEFMHNLFQQGAFQAGTPNDAYFVKSDSTVITQDDINRGVLNITVGFAPLKPAEFVVIKIQHTVVNPDHP